MKIDFVKYSLEFLEKSFVWLSNPEIKALTNTPEFTKEEQLVWYGSLETKDNYLIWGIEVDHDPIGVCGLKNISKEDCEYWGYIGEKEYWGQGIGSCIMNQMIDVAKQKKLSSMYLHVLGDNLRAIKLYEKFGFIIENKDGNLLLMRYVL